MRRSAVEPGEWAVTAPEQLNDESVRVLVGLTPKTQLSFSLDKTEYAAVVTLTNLAPRLVPAK